jgi:hypothetical protein
MLKACLVVVLLTLGLVLPHARLAGAQVCGDADGNGTVTVTDGVAVLRAAAGLSSSCTIAVCDVDGNGTIGVTDGINVLRNAAGLSSTMNCSGSPSASQVIGTVLVELQPLLTAGLAFATGTPVTSCANGPDDGTIDVSVDMDGTDTSFTTCQVGNIELDGDIVVNPSMTMLTFSLLDALTAGAEDFVGEYDGALTLSRSGDHGTLNGPLDVSTQSASDFTMTFTNTVIVGSTLTGGSALLDLTGSDIEATVTMIRLTFDGTGVAKVVATLGDGSMQNFSFNIVQGTLGS